MLLGLGGKAFVFVEESGSGGFNLTLVNAPSFSELVKNVKLCVHNLDGSLLGNVIETHNTIRNTLRF